MSNSKKKKEKKVIKSTLVQARLDGPQMQEVVNKAFVYSKGNVSAFVREAVLNYRPLKKVLR